MLVAMINWHVAFPLGIFFAIMIFVWKPFAFWGAEAYGWLFAALVIPPILLIAWLLDLRDRQKALR